MHLSLLGWNIHIKVSTKTLLMSLYLLYFSGCLAFLIFGFQSNYMSDDVNRNNRILKTEELEQDIIIINSNKRQITSNFENGSKSKLTEYVNKSVVKDTVTLENNGNTYKIKMAMDNVKDRYDLILEKQHEILRSQVRPDDSSYNVNMTRSDMISMDRDIPDPRPKVCKYFNYNLTELPTASVVIPFYNEGLSTLLRTVHSVLNRSPDELLTEVILVDDFSDYTYLHEPLTDYIKLLPKTRIIRNQERQGLIRTRMNGFREIKGDAVIFLDSHTEANVGWLEPLLDELRRHPNSVVQPVIDKINYNTFGFNFLIDKVQVGVFGWQLRHMWLDLPNHEANRAWGTGHPFPSPTLQGSAMCMLKEYFEYIGGFDEGMEIWGGENTELGMRAWMCGGRVVTVICSRVGHVFRPIFYSFGGDTDKTITKNLMRVAETWLDEYRKFFYASNRAFEVNRVEFTQEDLESLEKRAALRKKLNCHNFDWYLYNVIPQFEIPPTDALFYGEIYQPENNICWKVSFDDHIGIFKQCNKEQLITPLNTFSLTESGLLKHRGRCVVAAIDASQLKTAECPKTEGELWQFGKWTMINKGPNKGQISVLLKDSAEGKIYQYCVENTIKIVNPKLGLRAIGIYIAVCDKDNYLQDWVWEYKFDWSQVPETLLNIEHSINKIGL